MMEHALDASQAQKQLDDAIDGANLEALAQEILGSNEQAMSPPFDNRFFNHFVNSPNFTKRL